MAGVPEFILKKLFVKNSLQETESGFSFILNNTFAPATIHAVRMEVDGVAVPPDALSVQTGEQTGQPVSAFSSQVPLTLPVNRPVKLTVDGMRIGKGELKFFIDTLEAGQLVFTIQAKAQKTDPVKPKSPKNRARFSLANLLPGRQRAVLRVDSSQKIGEVNPYIYGHFIEHLEDCIYGGIWTKDGSRLRDDTLSLIRALQPPLVRYPGGNFASGYHWEDGVGPKNLRPQRVDRAWNAHEGNQVGTDEFMQFCQRVGAEPFLVVNDATGSPQEAARWVAYCNQDASGELGSRRAENGHPDPYGVRLWGVGNEVWGQWQIGHCGPQAYADRLRPIVEAMRAEDGKIKIVAVGDKILSDNSGDAGRRWNEIVLRQAGDLIDYLSFHIYQPDREGWQERYDAGELHHTVCAAPLAVENIIRRISEQIQRHAPGKGIKIALDEWNLWLPPPPEASSMHKVRYTLRDALYTAGMLNVFVRQCRWLQIANLAQLVNVLPLIVTNDTQAYATPIYYPFLMYKQMEAVSLAVEVESGTYNTPQLGNIEALNKVPYIDAVATCSHSLRRVVIAVINRHPTRRVDLSVRLFGFPDLRPKRGWLLSGPDPLAENNFTFPDRVKSREIEVHNIGHRSRFTLDLPASSVSLIALEE